MTKPLDPKVKEQRKKARKALTKVKKAAYMKEWRKKKGYTWSGSTGPVLLVKKVEQL